MYKSSVSKFQNHHRKMILEGNLVKTIIILILPIACINIVFHILPKYIDMAFLDCSKENNNTLDSFFLISTFVKLLNFFGITIAMAGIILVGYELGKNNITKVNLFVQTTIITVIISSLLIALISAIIGYFQIQPNMDLYIYYLASLISGVLVSINTVFLGLAITDSKLKIIYLSNIIFIIAKILFNFLFFICFQKTGMLYLGLSSVLANILLFLFIFVFFCKKYNQKIKLISANNQSSCIKKFFYFKSLIKMFIPLLLGRIIPESARVILMYFMKQPGFYSSGTLSMINLADAVVGLGLQFGFALEEVQMLIIAENLGNNNIQRAFKTIWIVLIMNFILGIIFTVFICQYGVQVLSLLQTLSHRKLDESNFETDKFQNLIWYASVSGFFTTVVQGILLKSMVAFKKPRIDMCFGFIKGFVLRIPLIFYFKNSFFEKFKGENSWKGYGVANLLANIILLCFVSLYFYFRFYQKMKKNNFRA